MKVLYDTTLRRPGCVLLAAAYGADIHVASLFDSRDWLVSPTEDMRVYELNEDQLRRMLLMKPKP